GHWSSCVVALAGWEGSRQGDGTGGGGVVGHGRWEGQLRAVAHLTTDGVGLPSAPSSLHHPGPVWGGGWRVLAQGRGCAVATSLRPWPRLRKYSPCGLITTA